MKKSYSQSELLVHKTLNLRNVFTSCFPFLVLTEKGEDQLKTHLNLVNVQKNSQAVNGILMWRLDIMDETTGEPNKAGVEFIRLTQ